MKVAVCVSFSLLFLSSLAGQEVRRAIPVMRSSTLSSSGVSQQVVDVPTDWQESANWFAHDPLLQNLWNNYRLQRYEPMQAWAREMLPSRMPSPAVVRYLFSGPDLLSVMALFPDASTYILCGKEPLGKMLSLDKFSPQELQDGSAQFLEITKTFLQYGYFITKEMRTQMRVNSCQGVVPLLLLFLALSDHRILSVEMLSLGGAPGVKIRFVSRSGIVEQQLFYAQADLSNEGSHDFLKWLQRFGSGATYLKAASYLLHEENFSRTRDFLLHSSTALLEDDSGIPFRCFSSQEWVFYFFGQYKGPIELFQQYDQPNLAAAYAHSLLSGPMPFGTGYQLNAGEAGGANLLLAVKRDFVPKALPVRSAR